MISPREFAVRWCAGLCRLAGLGLAAVVVLCASAEAGPGKIVLVVPGGEPESGDLQELVEEFVNNQPPAGPPPSLGQGALPGGGVGQGGGGGGRRQGGGGDLLARNEGTDRAHGAGELLGH